MTTRKPFVHAGKQGDWTVVQTTPRAHVLYGGYKTAREAEGIRDGFKRMDGMIKRTGLSYRVVNFGDEVPRATVPGDGLKRNPKRKPRAAKTPARAARVERTNTKTVRVRAGRVERTTTQRVRKTNPHTRRQQFALVAKSTHGRTRMRYTGSSFANHGRAVMFPSMAAVSTTASKLRERFGGRLQKYSLYAEPAAGKH